MLRIGDLPVVEAAYPLGARIGSSLEVSLHGRALDSVESVWLAPVRRAEYYRLTFPFTVPLRTDQRPEGRIQGEVSGRGYGEATVRFGIPEDAWLGLWRLWVRAPGGISDSVSLEISAMDEPDCRSISPLPEGVACNGVLENPDEEDEFWLELSAGQPVVVTTLAAQLGMPRIDTVLELFDIDGNLVAEHDDLMTGQGTVIGNPDSMLRFRPEAAGRFRLLVRDRTGRGGPDMAYRLRIEEREPGFVLLSDPENLNVRPGETESVGVLMVPEPGFDEAVEVWLEDPPGGVASLPARFRAGQFFGPSGDGDNVVIPAAFLNIRVASGLEPGEILRDVEWNTFAFFTGLFILVGGMVEAGVIDTLQEWMVDLAGGEERTLSLLMLYIGGGVSAIIDNIPFTATMIHVVGQIVGDSSTGEVSPLWWALTLGADLGGNLTIVGASANVVVVTMARTLGHPISFFRFLRYGIVIGIVTLIISGLYVWLRYY